MRSYPMNSPQAAARVLALMMIADGNVCASEMAVLNKLKAEQRLGLPEGGMQIVLRDLCEDLLMAGRHGCSLLEGLDDASIHSIMSEVTAPYLRDQVLELANAVAGADDHWADGELVVLDAACKHWALAPQAMVQSRMLA